MHQNDEYQPLSDDEGEQGAFQHKSIPQGTLYSRPTSCGKTYGGKVVVEYLRSTAGPVRTALVHNHNQLDIKPTVSSIQNPFPGLLNIPSGTSSEEQQEQIRKAALPSIVILYDYECEVCREPFKTKTGLEKHVSKIHPAENWHECEICHKRYRLKGHLATHKIFKHSEAKPLMYDCEVCRETFNTKTELETHVSKIHPAHDPTTEIWHVCEICQKRYRQKGHLATHKIFSHSEATPFTCTHCNVNYKTMMHLKNHLRRKHGIDQTNHQCQICHETFSHKGSLNSHVKMTHVEKSFECQICHKRFASNVHLANHMRCHEKDVVCPICFEKFMFKSQLNDHIKGHNTKLFTCKICQKIFTNLGQLYAHKATHQVEFVGSANSPRFWLN